MPVPFPAKKYKIIYADPPWFYRDKTYRGAAVKHYPVMRVEQVCALPVQSIAENDSVLLLWVTFPQLREGLTVAERWGFQYKTVGFLWVKTNKFAPGFWMGTGRYTRSNAELCLIATRGKGVPRLVRGMSQLIIQPRGEHSTKPEVARSKIVELFGDQPRIELFARQRANGWDAWGLDV